MFESPHLAENSPNPPSAPQGTADGSFETVSSIFDISAPSDRVNSKSRNGSATNASVRSQAVL